MARPDDDASPARRSPRARSALAGGLVLAVAIVLGAAAGCGPTTCDRAALHEDECLGTPSVVTSTNIQAVECIGSTECAATCVLDADCTTIKTFLDQTAKPDNPLRKCLDACSRAAGG
ncbi:MAG TPA: hypothetical protein VHB21_13195 [Minicystis sp.]|nr:hypothetical protein [Minicystis sp.]